MSDTNDGRPSAGWPSRARLEYVQKFITALLLALAAPWLFWKLITAPAKAVAVASAI